jgi:hypothetical protein
LYGINDASIENSELKNVPNCMINVDYSYNTYFSNVINDINDKSLYAVKYCSGEGDSSINSNSSYNLGWFPNDYTLGNLRNINELSLYNRTHSYDVIDGILVHNNTKSYFILPQCISNWIKQIEPCVNGVSRINYLDNNYCESIITLPELNDTNEVCSLIPITDSKNIFATFTELDLIFIIILGITLYFPFYMNNKKYYAVYVFSGIILCLYTLFLTNKMLKIFIDNTFFIYFLRDLLWLFAGILLILGGLQAWSNLMDMIYGEKNSKGMRKK